MQHVKTIAYPQLKHLLCTNRSGHDSADILLSQTIQAPERSLETRGRSLADRNLPMRQTMIIKLYSFGEKNTKSF